MKKLSIILLILLTACEGEKIPNGYECGFNNDAIGGGCKDASIAYKQSTECSNPKILAKFVVDCAKAANPLSDEEGEDLVAQCAKTAESIFCKTTRVYLNETN